jgi:hypothetical protein
MANIARTDGRQEFIIKGESGDYAAEVTSDNKLKVQAQVSASATGEIYGWDLYPSAWTILGGTITTDDWVKITIDGYDSQYTILEGDTWEDVVQGLVDAINNNSNVNAKVDAFSHYKMVFVRAETQGDEFNNLTYTTSVSGGATITATANNSVMTFYWKEVLVEEDPNDRRYGWLGIFGDVGSRTKADNPINICVRKTLATQNQQVFADKTVPADTVWYIGGMLGADDVGGEMQVWEGIERDKVDSWSADGTLFTHVLSYGCLKNSTYHSVKVNGGGTYVQGTDYAIEDCPTDETKSQIRWIKSQTMPLENDTVTITYDAVIRRAALFVQASSSQEYTFHAPIKLQAENFIIASVEQKSSNAAVCIINLSGFYEELR